MLDATHILLGRPWQHGITTIHNGRDNTISFTWNNHPINLRPKTKPSDLISTEKESYFLVIAKTGQEIEEIVKDVGAVFPIVVKGVLLAEEKEAGQEDPRGSSAIIT